MATCSNTECHAEIAAGDEFCGHCGARQDRFKVADTRPGYDMGEAGTVAGPLTPPSGEEPFVSADGPAAPPAWPGSSPAEPGAGAGGRGPGSAAGAAVV